MMSSSGRRLLLACILSVAALVAVAAPGTASAASDLGKQCSGENIKGHGSTFQAPILVKWAADFNEVEGHANKNAKACGGTQGSKGKPTVTYEHTGSNAGSGACLHGWGAESSETLKYAEFPFCGTDEAPNATQKGEIEKNKTSAEGSESESLEEIPVLQGAVVAIVHLPEGCKAKSEITVKGVKTKLGRLVFDDTSLEGIFSGKVRSWKALLANQAKTSKDPGSDALSCTGGTESTQSKEEEEKSEELHIIKYESEGKEVKLPKGEKATAAEEEAEIVTPVVRLDHSGTTHIFKSFLEQVDTEKLEMEAYPEEIGGKATGCHKALPEESEPWTSVSEACQNQRWPTAAHIVRGTESGNPGVIKRVDQVQSTVGYADLAVARELHYFSANCEKLPTECGGENKPEEQNTKFWAEVQNSKTVSVSGFSDPSTDGDVEAAENSRCKSTKFTDEAGKKFPPESTRKPWNEAKAELTESEYSICGLTYDLALRQYGFYPGLDEVSEETLGKGEANTVHDFLLWALNTSKEGGGSLEKDTDYEKLPSAIIKEAEHGVEEIGYKKAGTKEAKEKT
ncbi:MAG TPA: hypothetical protein VNV37_00385 [Solirubrobacteraceae bacterium]|jgi:ABC-type phosphate transport system substrate-binding protein|nr:hypothetical protein [Solirubrobacteraceae bacterium]